MTDDQFLWTLVGVWGACFVFAIGSYVCKTRCQGYQRLEAIQEVEDEEPYLV